MPPTIRPVTREELADWFAAFGTAFYIWSSDPQARADFSAPRMDLTRCLGAFEGPDSIGRCKSLLLQLFQALQLVGDETLLLLKRRSLSCIAGPLFAELKRSLAPNRLLCRQR